MNSEFGKLFVSIFMGLDPFPRRRVEYVLAWRWQMCKCVLADYNMRSSPRPTDLVMLSSTIVRGAPAARYQMHIPWTGSRDEAGGEQSGRKNAAERQSVCYSHLVRSFCIFVFVVTGATTSSPPRAGDISPRAMSQNSVQ